MKMKMNPDWTDNLSIKTINKNLHPIRMNHKVKTTASSEKYYNIVLQYYYSTTELHATFLQYCYIITAVQSIMYYYTEVKVIIDSDD